MVAEVSSLRHLGAGVAFTQDTDIVEAFSNPTLRVVRRGIASAISKVALKGFGPSRQKALEIPWPFSFIINRLYRFRTISIFMELALMFEPIPQALLK